MAEVIRADLAFEAVRSDGMRGRHNARVVHQYVDAVDSVGELSHRGQVLQVELAHLNVAGHLPGGGCTPVAVTHGQDYLCADPASSRAVTAPSPLLAPVTMAVRPANEGRSAAVHEVMENTVVRWRYFAATVNPWMIFSMSTASAMALSARLVTAS